MADSLKKKFSRIYDQNIEKIYRFVFLKVNSKELAQDLCSEIFLKTWQMFIKTNQSKNNKIQNITAYLYQIARNSITDYYRKSKFQTVSIENNPIEVNDIQQNPEKKAILNADLEKIQQELTNLKEDYQNVIIWYYLDNLSIHEIAKIMNKTKPTTRVLLHRALEALRKQVKKI